MALTFGGATSDRVEVTAASSINDLNPFTLLCWLFPTTLTSGRSIFQKGAGTTRKRFVLSGTTGNVSFLVDRNAGVDANYITSSTPLASTSTWIFMAASFASASTPSMHIYQGTLTAAATECTYGTTTNGSGAVDADNGGNLTWGNRPNADTSNIAFQGRIAYCAYVAKAMSLGECVSWQFDPGKTAETKLFMALGFNGTGTQPDWSGNGNAGTVTGATQVDHVPLAMCFAADPEWAGAFTATVASSPPVGKVIEISQAVKLGSTW